MAFTCLMPVLTPAEGHAERVAVLAMIEPRADRPRAVHARVPTKPTTQRFVNELRSMTGRRMLAQNTSVKFRRSTHARRAMAAMPSRQRRPQAHRRGVRLDQRRWLGRRRRSSARSWSRRVGLHLRCRRRNLVRLPKLIAERG